MSMRAPRDRICRRIAVWGGLIAWFASACGPAAPPPAPARPAAIVAAAPVPQAAEPTIAAPTPEDAEEAKRRAVFDEMLQKVARARQWQSKHPVKGEYVSRERGIALIMAKTKRELPEGLLEAQGELLRSLGLVALDYDFVAGLYALVESQIAGFYDPDTATMYLLDDLPRSAVEETLAHELVHALQDQHHQLGKILKHSPGDSDRVAAGHAFCEGEATSASLDVSLGSASVVSPNALRKLMLATVAMSGTGADTPRILQLALVSPYVDGFRFIQQLRERGDWTAVDRVWQRLPRSSEQLLHLDKYDSDEAPEIINKPPLGTFGGSFASAWEVRDSDVLGEQGIRQVLEQWTHREQAHAASTGWAGDRYVVTRAKHANGNAWASSWAWRFDTVADAIEAEAVVRKRFPQRCTARADLGPFSYLRKGRSMVLSAGPYTRSDDGKKNMSAASCGESLRWTQQVMAATAPTP